MPEPPLRPGSTPFRRLGLVGTVPGLIDRKSILHGVILSTTIRCTVRRPLPGRGSVWKPRLRSSIPPPSTPFVPVRCGPNRIPKHAETGSWNEVGA